MEKPMLLSLCADRYLPGKGEDRGVDSIGRGQCGGRVEKAWAGNYTICLRRPRCQCRPSCHVSGALFMTGVDWGDLISSIEKSIEKVVVLNAWQTIELIDAILNECVNGQRGDCRCHEGAACF